MFLPVKEIMGNAQYLPRYCLAASETFIMGPVEESVASHERTSQIDPLVLPKC